MLRIRTASGEEALDLAEFEARVLKGEIPPDTPVHFPVVTGDAFVPARELEIFRGLYSPARIYFMRYFNLSRFPWITSAIVVANVIVYVAMVTTMRAEVGHGDVTGWMVRFGAKSTPLIQDLGQTWRFLTANFVHKDILHIAFNLFVLFNVGGALENAFRPLDYLAIVLASALGTTFLSYLGSDAISAGASGIVFGFLGGAVVFGFKYREIIPRRYRHFFGGSVMPYVLVFLWIGWMSTGIDNWGHLGGLIGGSVTTFFLRPRLLDAGLALRRRALAKATALCAVIGAVALGGPVWARMTSHFVLEHDDEFGIEVSHPEEWRHAITHLGQLGFSNGMPEPTMLQVRTEQRRAPVDLSSLADDWFDLQLDEQEHAGRIHRVRRGPGVATTMAGLPARSYYAAFETTDEGGHGVGYLLRMIVFARGDLAYTLVMLGPKRRFDAYQPIFHRILGSVRVVEPRFERQARAGVLLFPEAPGAHERFGEALARLGDVPGAERAYRAAQGLAPGDPTPELALARLLLHDPTRRKDGLTLLAGVIRKIPGEAGPRELLGDYLLAAGDEKGALAALEAAAARDPGDARLGDRIAALRRKIATSAAPAPP